jgi:energy-coupling factor transporter ATP-binding protein EcfA2
LFFLKDFNAANLEEKHYLNPYKGLSSYEKDDQGVFFGREVATKELLEKVKNNRFVMVTGASGTGKSSLVKAGLLPNFQDKKIIMIRPGKQPAQVLPNNNDWDILVVDQWEELITQANDAKEVNTFYQKINEFLTNGKQVIGTVRADFEAQVRDVLLEEDWKKGRFLVPAFTPDEYHDVIVQPARRVACLFENNLIEDIKKEVNGETAPLPLLSFLMQELFEKAKKKASQVRRIRQSDYQQLEGLSGALQGAAEQVHKDLSKIEGGQDMMRRILLRMVSLSAGEMASKRVYRDELHFEADAPVEKVITALVDARLIRSTNQQVEQSNSDDERPYLEPAHDALIRAWKQILDWVKTMGKDNLFLLNKLSTDVADFQSKSFDVAFLWHNNPRLNQVLGLNDYQKAYLNVTELIFVEDSKVRQVSEMKALKEERDDALKRGRLLDNIDRSEFYKYDYLTCAFAISRYNIINHSTDSVSKSSFYRMVTDRKFKTHRRLDWLHDFLPKTENIAHIGLYHNIIAVINDEKLLIFDYDKRTKIENRYLEVATFQEVCKIAVNGSFCIICTKGGINVIALNNPRKHYYFSLFNNAFSVKKIIFTESKNEVILSCYKRDGQFIDNIVSWNFNEDIKNYDLHQDEPCLREIQQNWMIERPQFIHDIAMSKDKRYLLLFNNSNYEIHDIIKGEIKVFSNDFGHTTGAFIEKNNNAISIVAAGNKNIQYIDLDGNILKEINGKNGKNMQITELSISSDSCYILLKSFWDLSVRSIHGDLLLEEHIRGILQDFSHWQAEFSYDNTSIIMRILKEITIRRIENKNTPISDFKMPSDLYDSNLITINGKSCFLFKTEYMKRVFIGKFEVTSAVASTENIDLSISYSNELFEITPDNTESEQNQYYHFNENQNTYLICIQSSEDETSLLLKEYHITDNDISLDKTRFIYFYTSTNGLRKGAFLSITANGEYIATKEWYSNQVGIYIYNRKTGTRVNSFVLLDDSHYILRNDNHFNLRVFFTNNGFSFFAIISEKIDNKEIYYVFYRSNSEFSSVTLLLEQPTKYLNILYADNEQVLISYEGKAILYSLESYTEKSYQPKFKLKEQLTLFCPITNSFDVSLGAIYDKYILLGAMGKGKIASLWTKEGEYLATFTAKEYEDIIDVRFSDVILFQTIYFGCRANNPHWGYIVTQHHDTKEIFVYDMFSNCLENQANSFSPKELRIAGIKLEPKDLLILHEQGEKLSDEELRLIEKERN